MKAILRLKGKIRSRRKLSAVSYQPSALNSSQFIKYCVLDKARSLRSFLQFILVFFVSCSAALAQESVVHTTPAVQAEASASKVTNTDITPLKIGDKIPDELWEMYFPVVSANSDQVQYLSLGDFKDKLIILDFWATWCAPCISSLHKLDTLQEQFKDDLMVIPASYEPENKIRPFLMNRKIDLPSLMEEKELKKYFPHRSVPHQVWIKDEEVIAITGPKESSNDNIESVLKSKTTTLKEKKELKMDYFKSIDKHAINGNVPIYSQSIFTGFIEGTGGTVRLKNDSVQAFSFLNRAIPALYADALKLKFNQILIESENYEKFTHKTSDDKKYIFCYQIFFPINIPDTQVQAKFISDLNTQFNLNGRFEKRWMNCFIITEDENNKTVIRDYERSKYRFSTFVGLLNYSSKWSENLVRFEDESGFKGYLKKGIKLNEIALLKEDIPALRKYLNQYGLQLELKAKELDFFILSELPN